MVDFPKTYFAPIKRMMAFIVHLVLRKFFFAHRIKILQVLEDANKKSNAFIISLGEQWNSFFLVIDYQKTDDQTLQNIVSQYL